VKHLAANDHSETGRTPTNMNTVDNVRNPSAASTNDSRKRLRRLFMPAAGFAALVALSSCAADAPQDTWKPKGPNAEKIDNLQKPVFMIAGVVFVIVATAVVFCVVKFRDRGQSIPHQTHGKPALEVFLTIVPAMILVGIGIPTIKVLMDLSKTSDTQCYVNVTGQQWWWEYDYPVQPGCVEGGITEPIVTSGELVIPAGTKVLARISSRDVIHSYWIPALNGKKDAVPGRVQVLRLQADHPGIYAGQCTEFCGLSHAYMRMDAVALDDAGFKEWVDNQLQPYEKPAAGTPEADDESAFITNCSRCHQVNGITDSEGKPIISRPDLYVYAGAAPNLTNLMTRTTFAGASFDLLTDDCMNRLWSAPPDEFSALYLQGVTPECFNAVQLREWLRDAPGKKPMYVDPTELGPSDEKYRGMPNLGLSEDQIDKIIAYLTERK
jgi:cytochrome c oxidase subunit II